MTTRKLLPLLGLAAIAIQIAAPARAGVLLQGFYTDVPSPAAGSSGSMWWWDTLAAQASAFKQAGFTAVWIPPVLKGAAGGYSGGYDPFDDYDMGSKNQQGTYPTRFGTREQVERSVSMLRANGLDVYADLVENHRGGDDGYFNFYYNDAYGNARSGRFQKGPGDFHFSPAGIPEDPDVPDVNADETYQFGRDLAPINGYSRYAYNGLLQSGDWLTKALDIQGYRLDDVKGISTDWLLPFLNYGAMSGKFAVGEYYDSSIGNVQYWIGTSMQNRSSAFDFALRDQIKAMCSGGGYYDMTQLDGSGLVGQNPGGAVTFVENHDTDGSSPITANKMLGYALILTSQGYPCVFYKDWSTDPGCYGLKTGINNLIWVHETLASGPTVQRWKDSDVFAYERTGNNDGRDLIVGLNDNGSSSRTVTVQTNFGANVSLHDYTGHSPDIFTNGSGRATITIPADVNGGGYVCYSWQGYGGTPAAGGDALTAKTVAVTAKTVAVTAKTVAVTAKTVAVTAKTVGGALSAAGLRSLSVSHAAVTQTISVTQEYAGAQDLDIKPADNTAPVQVCRVWAAKGTAVTGALYWDGSGWDGSTDIVLELDDPTLAKVASGTYSASTSQGTAISTTASRTGWYVFKIHSDNTPATNAKPAYWLRATYTAPQT